MNLGLIGGTDSLLIGIVNLSANDLDLRWRVVGDSDAVAGCDHAHLDLDVADEDKNIVLALVGDLFKN